MNTVEDQRLRDIQRQYVDFLDDETGDRIYNPKMKDLISENRVRLMVNINHLRSKNATRASALLSSSFEEMLAFQRALKEMIGMLDAVYVKQREEFFIGLEGSFGARHLTPRRLAASFLGDMVCVEGIVTKCSLVRPKVVKSVHYCQSTDKVTERRYTDMTSLDPYPSSAGYPTKDEQGNTLETEYGLCVFKDNQTFSVQEMPEKSPAGQMPRSVDVIVDDDLVDVCKPGDRVQVVGMYRCLPGKRNGYTNGTFRTILIANSIHMLTEEEKTPRCSKADVRSIHRVAKDKKQDAYDLLARSLAPSIYGHEYIKKAILCMLLGGSEKILDNGTRIRGDINVLLIGDPSVAKSQILRFVLHTAPIAITTTGRGSSGVGLTAAVTTDQESGERRLEAGAMVLADRGVVCIDEFDKMSDIDRTAIHEVMEQGRVTIAKAGIHARLNARCSVLAAANPVYGRYDQYKTPMENIGLQDSLLSRFDLLFIMLDTLEPENDRQIADHVLRMHRYRNPREQEGDAMPLHNSFDLLSTLNPDIDRTDERGAPVYERFDPLLHNRNRRGEKLLSMEFMRKYIHMAREVKPILGEEAAIYIANEYAKLRNQETLMDGKTARTQPVTARSLETMIRLATAHAKARMNRDIELEDAQCAVELVHYAYFKKVPKKPRRKRQEDSEEDGEERVDKRPRLDDEGPDIIEDDTATEPQPREDVPMEVVDTPRVAPPVAVEEPPKRIITAERLTLFKSLLHRLFQRDRAQAAELDRIERFFREESPDEPFSEDEILAAVDVMMEDNQLMLADNLVFLI